MTTIINLTPHTVNIFSPEGHIMMDYPASGQIARVSMQDAPAGELEGIPLVVKKAGGVVGLPAPAEGTFYIVSGLIQSALPSRDDLLVPDDLVRDNEGRVIGCRRFSINTNTGGEVALEEVAKDILTVIDLVNTDELLIAPAMRVWAACDRLTDFAKKTVEGQNAPQD